MAKVKLKNNTVSHNLTVTTEGKTYYIKKKDCIVIDTLNDIIPIEISVDRRDKVSVKWLNVILTEAIDTDARSTVYFDYRCTVKADDNCELIIVDNNYRENDSLKLSSVRIVSPSKNICEEEYSHSNDGKSCKRKHTLLQMIFLSGLPWVILGVIYSFFDLEIGLIIAIVILFFVATVPSIKSVKRFNKAINSASDLLSINIIDRCDYDKVEYVANEIIKDNETKGVAKVIAKVLKHLVDSI